MENYILDGIIGLCVADALGVPVEFIDRKILMQNPVVDMRSGGTYNKVIGTWSDDTSMTLCLVESLSRRLDYHDIMGNFMKWANTGEYTASGEVFEIGNGARKALMRFERGTSPLECGGKSEFNNGDGSLMRILPIVFYLQSIYGVEFQDQDDAFERIHNLSKLTHAHQRSQMACGIYISVASMLISRIDLKVAVKLGIEKAMNYYRKKDDFADELKHFKWLEREEFINIPMENIKTSGYVVDTLEAGIWCLLTTTSYKECVLKAVNLGDDTATAATVAGGLSGLYYGYKQIPEKWVSQIAKKEYIIGLCETLDHAIQSKVLLNPGK